ncbi:MAG: pentapeptide repeat-containing protein [Myxococcota bacterium]|nr:pentapeptide repeat-containing protein [Myxococcota bacterium]
MASGSDGHPQPPPKPQEGYRGRDLTGTDLSGAELQGQNFIQANLTAANLSGANLTTARLHGARLRSADLSNVQGEGLGAREVDLESADLTGAALRAARLTDAVLLEANLTRADLQQADLSGADLRASKLVGANLSGADLSGADLSGADLTDAVLDGVRARGARIANIQGLSEEALQVLLDAGATSGALQQATAAFQRATTRLTAAISDLRSSADRPADDLSTADIPESDIPDWRERTSRLQQNWRESRQRAAAARQRQEEEWMARRAAEAEQRQYRRENREEYREERESLQRKAAEVLQRERQRLQQRRRAEEAIEEQTSRLLRQARLEARQRFEEQARVQAAEQAMQQAAQDAVEAERQRIEAERQRIEAKTQAERLTMLAQQHSAAATRLNETIRHLSEDDRRRTSVIEDRAAELDDQQRQVDALRRRLLLLERTRHTEEQSPTSDRLDAINAQLTALSSEEQAHSAALAESTAALEDARSERRRLQERLTLTRDKAGAAEQLAVQTAAQADLARNAAGTAELPALPAGMLRRLTDRNWFALTDRIGQQSPRLANALDHRREQLLTLPSRLRSQWRAQEADADKNAQSRIERRLRRLSPDTAPPLPQRRAAAEERVRAALSRAEDSGLPPDSSALERPAGPAKRLFDAIWYQGTDLLAALSRPLASRLDRLKERLEWEFISRRSEAARLLDQQQRDAEQARSKNRIAEHSVRIGRLQRLREREETRAQQRAAESARRAEEAAENQRLTMLRALSAPERHERRREQYSTRTAHTTIDHRGADMRGRKLTEVEWADADLQDARLDNARLDNADLTAANLQDASLAGARLDGATLDGATLDHATFDGARLRRASLLGAQLSNARMVDVDLRNADLTGADLTGADLRGASLFGAALAGANLTAARMPNLELEGVILDGAMLDQADLAGVQWSGASVSGADLSGALGLSGATREALARQGALAGDVALDDLFSRLGSRQVRVAAAVLILGLTAFLATSYLTDDTLDTAAVEGQAEELRSTDPLAASALYLELAEAGTRIEERIAYLIEAAVLADQGGDSPLASTLFARALEEAGDDATLAARVRLRRASFYADHDRWEDALEAVDPVLFITGQPTEQRARAVLLYERISAKLEQPADRLEAVFEELDGLPDAAAELRMSLAEVRSAQGEIDDAIAELAHIDSATISSDLALRVLETRARVQDRGGDLAGSAETLDALTDAAEEGSLMWQAASLQLADLKQRAGETEGALALVERILNDEPDPRIQGRALLVIARLHEGDDDATQAAEAYQTLLAAEGLDQEVIEEARVGLARILLSDGGSEAVQAALAELPPEYADQILGQARLGDARRMLDDGDPAAARVLYEEILEASQLSDALSRAARSGLGEALSALGNADEAAQVWSDLLAESPPPSERVYIELLLASGLLQSGKREQAETAFTSLASSTEPEIKIQGILGLAEVARANNERERSRGLYQSVVDDSDDPAWQVQALQELADLALEEDRLPDAMAAWRTVIGLVSAGDPAGISARLALVGAMAERGQADRITQYCQEATAAAATQPSIWQTCAEALEQAGENEAALSSWESLTALDSDEALDDDIFAEAALGTARALTSLGRHSDALVRCDEGLSRSTDPTVTMLLLSTQIAAATILGNDAALSEALAARDEMASNTPRLAAAILLESAQLARGADDPDQALVLLRQAIALPLSDEMRAGVALELGESLIDSGALSEAAAPLTQAAASEDPHTAFAASMALSELSRRSGDITGAITRLSKLTPPDDETRQWWLEAQASALTEAGDPASVEAWEALASSSSTDPGLQSAALRGRAEALLSQDRFEDALPLFREAAEAAAEPSMVGWAQLGEAEALRYLTRLDEARTLLSELSAHSDPEVSLQAAILVARLELDAEQPDEAIAALLDREATTMGPAWDASLCEIRVAALQEVDRAAEARAELEALAERWPDEEEAQLPAWLGLADLARDDNNPEDARRWAALALNSAQDPAYRDRAQEMVDQLGGE